MNILVTGAGSLLGQGIIKSLELSKLKFTLFATDYFSSAIGLYWAKRSFLLPDLLNTSITDNEWLDSLITILKNEKIRDEKILKICRIIKININFNELLIFINRCIFCNILIFLISILLLRK